MASQYILLPKAVVPVLNAPEQRGW